MNINNYKNLEKVSDTVNTSISDVLAKLKEDPKKEKEGVSLLDITKKLSEKKFGKKKK